MVHSEFAYSSDTLIVDQVVLVCVSMSGWSQHVFHVYIYIHLSVCVCMYVHTFVLAGMSE